MKSRHQCSQGHEWEVNLTDEQQTLNDVIKCPTCGEQAQPSTDLMPEKPTSPTEGNDATLATLGRVESDEGTHVQTVSEEEFRSTADLHFPGYDVLGELGRGGMGVVYKARQKGLNRLVALKVILNAEQAGAESRLRFEREAKAIASLDHPHIVRAYEVGYFKDKPFFSLEYVEGGNLAAKLAKGPMEPKDAAQLISILASAMQTAHDLGIIHRDLKPANILLTLDGSPKITDFGLAKSNEETLQTQSGALLGTPAYMSPEQASGLNKEVNHATDIYALGVILYQCLTCQVPFKAATPLETVLDVISKEAPSIRSVRQSIPQDLETIVRKCMEKDPKRRYGSASLLAEDLQRFLSGEPIIARPITAPERLWRWCRRYPSFAIMSASMILLLIAGTVVSSIFAVQAQKAAEEARAQAQLAAKNEREAEKQTELAKLKEKESRDNAAFANTQRELALNTLGAIVQSTLHQLGDPSFADLRKEFLKTATASLAEFSKSARNTPTKGISYAQTLNAIGEIYAQTSNYTAATKEHLEAKRFLNELIQHSPSAEAHLQLALTCAHLEKAYSFHKKWSEVRNETESQIHFGEEALKLDPNNQHAKVEIVKGLHRLRLLNLSEKKPEDSKAIEYAAQLSEQLSEKTRQEHRIQLMVGNTQAALAELLVNDGKLNEAEQNLQEALQIANAATKKSAIDYEAWELTLKCYLGLGSVRKQQNRSADALDYYLRIAEDGRSLPLNANVSRVLMTAGLELGDYYTAQNNLGEARYQYYHLALEYALALAKTDPTNRPIQEALASVYQRLGRISEQWQGWLGARHFYQRASRALSFGESQNIGAILEVHTALGRVNAKAGLLTEAEEHLTQAMEITKHSKLMLHPNTSLLLADVLARQGKWSEAASTLSTALTHSKGFTQARLLEQIALFQYRAGRIEDARKSYEKLLALALSIQQSNTYVLRARIGIGQCKLAQLQWNDSIVEFQKALSALQPINGTTSQVVKAFLHHHIKLCQAIPKATEDLAWAQKLPRPMRVAILRAVANELIQNAKLAEAEKPLQLLKGSAPQTGEEWFQLAEVYSSCAGRLSSREIPLYSKLQQSSIDALKMAIKNGFIEPQRLRLSEHLHELRKSSSYAQLLAEAQASQQDRDARTLINSIEMEMVQIPKGKFRMGSRHSQTDIANLFNRQFRSELAANFQSEHPLHEVEITRSFYMGATEVTRRQFQAFVRATGYKTDAERERQGGQDFNPTGGKTGASGVGNWQYALQITEDEPAVYVSRNDAIAFCKWLSKKENVTYRLPTEAEWEYACRGGTETMYWFGDAQEDLTKAANIPDLTFLLWFQSTGGKLSYESLPTSDGYERHSPVGEMMANPFGLYDTHGNVWEWCLDHLDRTFYQTSPNKDPVCERGNTYVLRGGCYM